MKPLKNQQGAVLILELVLLAIVVGVAGLALYQANKARQSTNQPTVATPHLVSPSQTVTPQLASNILSFTKFGFKMTLPAGLDKSDVVYDEVSNDQPIQTGDGSILHRIGSIDLTSKKLTQAASGCGIGAAGTGLIGVIGIEVYSSDPTKYQIASGPSGVKQVGSVWLGVRDRQAPCSVLPDNTISPLEDAYYGLFIQAYETASKS